MLTSTAPTARTRRRLTGAVGAGVLVASTVGVVALTQTSASGAILGPVVVSPASGTDETLFGGTAAANCPADATDSYWSMEGPGIRLYEAYLGPSANNGVGPQSFSGAAIANIKSNNAGSFLSTGTYRVVFNCFDAVFDANPTYEAILNYTAGGAGAYTITAAVVASPSPVTPVSPSPATPVSPSPATPVSPSPATPVSPSPATPVSPSPATPVSPSTSPGPGTGVGSGSVGTGGTGTGTGGSGTTGTGTGIRSTSGTLPRTGDETAALLALSLALIGGGAGMIVLGRRRNWFSVGSHQA